MSKFKRIFIIVMDSAGIGHAKDAEKFDDLGTNTFKHIAESMPTKVLKIPTLNNLGLGDLDEINGCSVVQHNNSYSLKLNELSLGKDTITGHWEMMGVNTKEPFQTFTETGFPQELINELSKQTGYKIIGNYSASGTEILKDLGEEQIRDNSLIVYTSFDSVLQICGHEKYMGLDELYRVCEIARKITMKKEWFVARIIARPYLGESSNEFYRTSNRHDYAINPPVKTAMDIMKENGKNVVCVGKINDIFNGNGVTETYHTESNDDGMDKTINLCKSNDFDSGLCFVNLVDFDSVFGHRRDAVGYGKALEQFDVRLKELIDVLKEDDLLMITADHGNDPTYKGFNHTREKVPLLVYSKSIRNGKMLDERNTFGDIGATVLSNFGLLKENILECGDCIEEILK